MLETLHRAGSRIRNSELLRRQTWLWGALEPSRYDRKVYHSLITRAQRATA